jgi:hypothetical protein
MLYASSWSRASSGGLGVVYAEFSAHVRTGYVRTYYVFRRDLSCARGNLGISATHVSDYSKCRTRRHNNDRKLRPTELIQQDDGEQYETRSHIIRIFRLLQPLKGEPTWRGVPYVCGPLTVNVICRIISEQPILVLFSRLHRVLPSGRFPSHVHTNNNVPCEQRTPEFSFS